MTEGLFPEKMLLLGRITFSLPSECTSGKKYMVYDFLSPAFLERKEVQKIAKNTKRLRFIIVSVKVNCFKSQCVHCYCTLFEKRCSLFGIYGILVPCHRAHKCLYLFF